MFASLKTRIKKEHTFEVLVYISHRFLPVRVKGWHQMVEQMEQMAVHIYMIYMYVVVSRQPQQAVVNRPSLFLLPSLSTGATMSL